MTGSLKLEDLKGFKTLISNEDPNNLTILNCYTFQSEQFLTLSNISNFSDIFQFWPFPIGAVSDTFQSKQFLILTHRSSFWPILTLSNSCSFWHFQIYFQHFWHFPSLTLSISMTFQFRHFPNLINSDTFRFWHFPMLTLSDSDNFQFWRKMHSDTFQF